MPTRSVDDLAKAMGRSGLGEGEVGHLFDRIDTKMKTFLPRPLEGSAHTPGALPLERRH